MPNYTVNPLQQAAWLVYINGLEIPVTRVDTSFGVWQMPTLSLQMVPHQLLQRIGAEDRLQVVVFYLDTHWKPEEPTFRLLGEFEVVGWGYNNTPAGRFIQLNCVSQLQIFEQLHFFYVASMNDIAAACGESVGGDTAGATVVKTMYPAALFLEGLTAPESVLTSTGSAPTLEELRQRTLTKTSTAGSKFIKTPVEFVVNIFRSILRPMTTVSSSATGAAATDAAASVPAGSKELPRSATSVPGKNFFARWLNMTKFHRRWVSLPVLEDAGTDECFPLLKAAQDTQTLIALQQQIGQSVGKAGSAWQLLQKVYGYMYMEVATIPCPPAAIVNKNTGKIEGPITGSAGSQDGATIPTFFVKPQCMFAMPPMCNVIFPSMLSSYAVKENYMPQPTRVYLSEGFMTNILAQGASASISTIAQEAMTTGYPYVIKKRMWDLKNSPQSNTKNMLIFPEEFFKGPITRRLNAPPWMYMLSQQDNANPNVTEGPEPTLEDLRNRTKSQASEAASGPLNIIFDKYAEYEFYRSRFAERSGGVSMAWNPYIVPGFPAMVFDERSEGFDTMAYVNNVTHTMSAQGQMSSNASLTFIRTLNEFIGILYQGLKAETSTYLPDVAPTEIIPDVSSAFQYADTTGDLYRRLFHAGSTDKAEVVFNWKTMMDVSNQQGETVDATYEQWKINKYVRLTPKAPYAQLFKSYEAAMNFISRPACSLREYIEIWHGASISELSDTETIKGAYRSFYSPASDRTGAQGAVFWGRIYKLIQGPGDTPSKEVTNIGAEPEYEAAGDDVIKFVGPATGMPQTREDWDAILEEYRKIVRSEGGKVAPQD